MEELRAAAKVNWVTDYNKQWLECALELLRLSSISLSVISDALYNSLRYGHSKLHNLILINPNRENVHIKNTKRNI